MIHNQQLKPTVRRSANLRPIEFVAVGLAAARGTIGRAQSVVPVVCCGLDRKHLTATMRETARERLPTARRRTVGGLRLRQYTGGAKQDGPDEWGHLLAVPSFTLDGTR